MRKVQFKFHYAQTIDFWKSDDFTRRFFQLPPGEAWTFEATPRVVYVNPTAQLAQGQTVIINAITKKFNGGKIYAWNPYDSTSEAIEFDEISRDATKGVSTFNVALSTWMTGGFNFKLVQPSKSDSSAV